MKVKRQNKLLRKQIKSLMLLTPSQSKRTYSLYDLDFSKQAF